MRLPVAGETPVSAAIALAGQVLATQHLDAINDGLLCRLAQPIGPRAAVLQASQAFRLEAFGRHSDGASDERIQAVGALAAERGGCWPGWPSSPT